MAQVRFVKAFQDAGRVQGDFLASALQMEIEELEQDGYDITHIIPVISGQGDDTSDTDVEIEPPSVTSGMIVVARKAKP